MIARSSIAWRSTSSLLVLLVAACGGSAPPSSRAGVAKDASSAKRPESIGDLVAAQGGLASLGGGTAELHGRGNEAPLTGPLVAESQQAARPVKLDGMLREWGPRSPAKEQLAGTSTGSKLRVAVQYDEAHVFVAAEVDDATYVRTSKLGESEDHLWLTLAFPSGEGQLTAYDVAIYPGKPGEAVGAVVHGSGPRKGKEIAGARVVEAPAEHGLTFEAMIPWATFDAARTQRVGLRAALRWVDGDGKKVQAVVGTGKGDRANPSALPPLPTTAEIAVVEGLLGPKGMSDTPPTLDLYADVAGDAMRERVSVFGRFFTICGPHYRHGEQFFFRELHGELVALEARDLTGSGKDDLLVRRRIAARDGYSEVLEVWSLLGGDEPQTVFSHEIAVVHGSQRVTNAVRVAARERAIELETQPAVDVDGATFRAGAQSGTQPILVPWGPTKSRVFRFKDGRFEVAKEQAQQPSSKPAAVAPDTAKASAPSERPPAKSPTSAADALIEAYRRDRSIGAGAKPQFSLRANVVGDAQPERVELHGRDLVVAGSGFAAGERYGFVTLAQFESGQDVDELVARDLDGDGAAELVVRGKRALKDGDGDQVTIEALFVYRVEAGAIRRVLGIETARAKGARRVEADVRFVKAPSGGGFDLVVKPGRAKGWTKSDYPWAGEGGGVVEPLVLPWAGKEGARYAWSGNALVKQ